MYRLQARMTISLSRLTVRYIRKSAVDLDLDRSRTERTRQNDRELRMLSPLEAEEKLIRCHLKITPFVDGDAESVPEKTSLVEPSERDQEAGNKLNIALRCIQQVYCSL